MPFSIKLRNGEADQWGPPPLRETCKGFCGTLVYWILVSQGPHIDGPTGGSADYGAFRPWVSQW